ncbi:MAG: hypothetical protein J0M17_14490 [Planctomycetes bacterium]|nr:hypothetical protein [Planctomycetota bacterium]
MSEAGLLGILAVLGVLTVAVHKALQLRRGANAAAETDFESRYRPNSIKKAQATKSQVLRRQEL